MLRANKMLILITGSAALTALIYPPSPREPVFDEEAQGATSKHLVVAWRPIVVGGSRPPELGQMLPDGHRGHYLCAARSHICSPPIAAVVWRYRRRGSCVPARDWRDRFSPLPATTGGKSATNPPPTRRQRRTESHQPAPFSLWFFASQHRRQMCSCCC